MKIVVNKCYGGFGLSEAAMRRYAELKGLTLWVEHNKEYPSLRMATYWSVPPEQRPGPVDWGTASQEERVTYNQTYARSCLYDRDIPRDDLHLVQTVEELGHAANGTHAQLQIVEIPDGVKWEIDEYDGMERVAEQHRTWG